MTTKEMTKMFANTSINEKDMEVLEQKLEAAANFERTHKGIRKFPRNAL